MIHFPYCGMLLLEAGLPPPTAYAGPGSERCCLCKSTLGRYTNQQVQTTSDGSEICEWCVKRAFDQAQPRYTGFHA